MHCCIATYECAPREHCLKSLTPPLKARRQHLEPEPESPKNKASLMSRPGPGRPRVCSKAGAQRHQRTSKRKPVNFGFRKGCVSHPDDSVTRCPGHARIHQLQRPS